MATVDAPPRITVATVLAVLGFLTSVAGAWGTYQVLSYRVGQLESRTARAEVEHERASGVEHATDLRLQRIEDSQKRIELALDELKDNVADLAHGGVRPAGGRVPR